MLEIQDLHTTQPVDLVPCPLPTLVPTRAVVEVGTSEPGRQSGKEVVDVGTDSQGVPIVVCNTPILHRVDNESLLSAGIDAEKLMAGGLRDAHSRSL